MLNSAQETDIVRNLVINLIINSGTELSSKGILLDKGRGAAYKTQGANANCASSEETSKEKGFGHASGLIPEACSFRVCA